MMETGYNRDIKSFTLERLQEEMESLGEKSFRAKQMYEWMHKKQAAGYEEMTNIPRALADKCRDRYDYTALEIRRVQESMYILTGGLPYGLSFLCFYTGRAGAQSTAVGDA